MGGGGDGRWRAWRGVGSVGRYSCLLSSRLNEGSAPCLVVTPCGMASSMPLVTIRALSVALGLGKTSIIAVLSS